jgi:7-cyano-7-deazaguanine synthase in queuosine biosynthesis
MVVINGYEKPCMECDSYKLRAKGFKEEEINDPALV